MTDVAVLDITNDATVGLGSFYNHFTSKEHLFAEAVDAAAASYGELIRSLTKDIEDPAVVFSHSFRTAGRMHR